MSTWKEVLKKAWKKGSKLGLLELRSLHANKIVEKNAQGKEVR